MPHQPRKTDHTPCTWCGGPVLQMDGEDYWPWQKRKGCSPQHSSLARSRGGKRAWDARKAKRAADLAERRALQIKEWPANMRFTDAHVRDGGLRLTIPRPTPATGGGSSAMCADSPYAGV